MWWLLLSAALHSIAYLKLLLLLSSLVGGGVVAASGAIADGAVVSVSRDLIYGRFLVGVVSYWSVFRALA
jgi:hypothetical protein